jgi:hypothetical protein
MHYDVWFIRGGSVGFCLLICSVLKILWLISTDFGTCPYLYTYIPWVILPVSFQVVKCSWEHTVPYIFFFCQYWAHCHRHCCWVVVVYWVKMKLFSNHLANAWWVQAYLMSGESHILYYLVWPLAYRVSTCGLMCSTLFLTCLWKPPSSVPWG